MPASASSARRSECRELADRLGWTVVEVYCDNDLSAYSGKRRPQYEQLLSDIESGEPSPR